MSSSSLGLFLHPPPLSLLPKSCHHYSLSPTSFSFKSFKTHNICFSSNPSSSNSHGDLQESRWLREEQRWLREEQRWLREEQRWARDRDSLLREIAELKLKIQALERQRGGASVSVSESETIANVAGLLQILKDKSRIAETGSSSRALELDPREIQEIEEVKEVIAVSEVKDEKQKKKKKKKMMMRDALRKGSEGKEVQAMQEALQKLGFYSGEEDMEFSTFTSGTERAVKTWQASLDVPQDGIVTDELLERLYMDPQIKDADDKWSAPTVTPKEEANGAAITSVTEIEEVQQTVGKEEVEVSRHRVFLLGENRWEDSSRLIANRKTGAESKTTNINTRCLTCRGEARLLCTECDGTGEPNIEEQFLDWVDEGAKCPYCEGLGYTICDVCQGTPVA